MAKADYLVAFEFHDDVLFLDRSKTPQSADFVQVKTSKSSTPRKRATLTYRPSGKSSILGKMCQNFKGICADHDVKVILVSNVAFEFADIDICARDLDEKHKNFLLGRLTDELPDLKPEQFDRVHFIVAGVSIEKMETYLQGETVNLFKQEFGEDHGLNVTSWIRLVQGEINRKNNEASDAITSVEDLIDKKCVGREFVDDTLALVSNKRRIDPDMGIINHALIADGWSHEDLMRLSKRMPQVVSDYTNPENVEVAEMAQRAQEALSSSTDGKTNIAELIKRLLPIVSIKTGNVVMYDRIYVSALVILVFHETI